MADDDTDTPLRERIENLEDRVARLEGLVDEDEHAKLVSAARDQFDATVLRLVIDADADLVRDPEDFRDLYNAAGVKNGRKIAKRVRRLTDQFFEEVQPNVYRLKNTDDIEQPNPLDE